MLGGVSMMQCPKCKSRHVGREHRTPEERRKYAAVIECYDCGHRLGLSPLMNLLYAHMPQFVQMPWFTFNARCPKCGNLKLRVFDQRDYIEGYHRNPVRFAQRLLGASLCYCWGCRLQFYDLRPRLEEKLCAPRKGLLI